MNILLVLNPLDEIGSWELHTGELIKDSSQFVALRAQWPRGGLFRSQKHDHQQ